MGGPSFTEYAGGSTSNNQTYDAFGRLTGLFDANRNLTSFAYDDNDNLASLTDALGNTTEWTYDEQGQLTQETNTLGDSRDYVYDTDGNLVRYIDRDGRVRDYGYDAEGRVTSETWYANVLDADAAQNAENTIHYAYDSADRLVSEWDNLSSVAYVYDTSGQMISTTTTSADSPTVTLDYQYDASGNRIQMSATIDGTADFVDDYTYDSQGRVVSVVEHGVSGGNAVAQKQIDMAYNTAGQLVSMARYLDDELVVVADYGYDAYDRLIGLVYRQGETILSQYVWTYSDPGEATVVGSSTSIAWQPTGGLMPITDTTGVTAALLSGGYSNLLSQLTSCTSSDGTVSYTYDATGQLTAAEYSDDTLPDEVYSYDANGNRTTDGTVTGADNRLLSDGTYAYLYDAEGNRTARFIDVNTNGLLDAGDTTITEYAWDARNRLDTVTDRPAFGSDPTQVVDYLYDTEDRWIGKDVDLDGDSDIDQQTRFVYNGNQIVLQFEGDSGEDLTVSDLSHRYLWNPTAVDHLMADEQVEMLTTPGTVVIPLSDHLGTIRDLAVYDPATYTTTVTTTVTTHRTYDAYGALLTATGSIDCLFGFTGRPFDNATDLQNNYHRWYDATIGRWISQDPIGFEGNDANLYRYVANSPIAYADPYGLFPVGGFAGGYTPTPSHIAEIVELREKERRGYSRRALQAIKASEEEFMYRAKIQIEDMFRLCKKVEITLDRDYWHLAPGVDEQGLITVTLTETDIRRISDVLSMIYVEAVEEFLADHPGARPSLGYSDPERSMAMRLNMDNQHFASLSPVCVDWAVGILDIVKRGLDEGWTVKLQNLGIAVKIQNLVKVELGQIGSPLESSQNQHNFVVIRPYGYVPKDPLRTDKVIRILDPWFDLMPRVYTSTTHPGGIDRIGLGSYKMPVK